MYVISAPEATAKSTITPAIEHCLQDGEGLVHFPPGDYRLPEPSASIWPRPDAWRSTAAAARPRSSWPATGRPFISSAPTKRTPIRVRLPAGVWAQRAHAHGAQHRDRRAPSRRPEASCWKGPCRRRSRACCCASWSTAFTFAGAARNLLISHCHIYNNRGVGVLSRQAELAPGDHHRLAHQLLQAGGHQDRRLRDPQFADHRQRHRIQLRSCRPRNRPISGSIATAEGSTVREGTIASNTIQAKYSPGGANMRILGFNTETTTRPACFPSFRNLIGSQETNVHLVACRGVVVSGNVIYSGHGRNLAIEGSRNIVTSANSFDHNPDYRDKELMHRRATVRQPRLHVQRLDHPRLPDRAAHGRRT